MKLTLAFHILFFISFCSFSQERINFEGTIKYDMKYISKDTFEVYRFCGSEAIVFIKEGYYKQEYPYSDVIKHIIYRSDSNKYYYFYRNTSAIQVQECSIADDTILSIERSDTIIEILGYKCNQIAFHFQEKTITYFYAQSLYIDPLMLKKHRWSSYDRYAQETSAIYLKIIISNATSDFVMTAKEIEAKRIDDNTFNITN